MRMKNIGVCSGLLFALSFTAAQVLADAIDLTLGMHGIALDYQKNLAEKVDVRFILSDVPLKSTIEESDIEYEVEYDRTNLGVLLDYRPLAGTFHLTGGMYINDHNWNMDATANNGSYKVGDTTYTSNNLAINAQIAFAKAAPYLGLGWGNSIQGTGLTANIDLGLLYIGTPSVSVKSSGQISTGGLVVDVNKDPAFQNDIEKERAQLEDDLKNFNVLPIIQFGMGYKF